MNKAYSRINFQNAPSTATPLNATNLNKMDKAINDLDDRIIELSGYQEEAQEAAEQASSSASAAAKAAETATADAEARVNAIIEGLEVYTKEESDKKFASVIKQVATGSPILIKDGTDAGAIDFKGKGRSTQNGTPTPDNPIAIESVADSGWFDGELLQGDYSLSTGVFQSKNGYVCGKNSIPCKEGDVVNIILDSSMYIYIYYYNENIYVSNEYKTNVTQAEFIIPNGITSFKFCIGSGSTNLTNAPHITVTINGKYALIVKSNNKNIFDYSRIATLSAYGATITNNNDGSFTISGSGTLTNAIHTYGDYSHEETVRLLKAGEIKLDINGVATTPYLYIQLRSGATVYFQVSSNDATKSKNVTQAMLDDENVYLRVGFYGASTGVSIVAGTMKPMLYQYGDSTYEPYKEEVKYIPLNEPLRSSLDGSVTDVADLGECETTRKFKEVVLDGTNLTMTYSNVNIAYLNLANLGYSAICTHFSYNHDSRLTDNNSANLILASGEFAIRIGTRDRIYFKNSNLTTLEQWTEWLKANPIRVIYELAEPITETIEPVDIVTYDNVTYLTASDDADMEVTYATDTKSYIDSKFAELHAALVNML